MCVAGAVLTAALESAVWHTTQQIAEAESLELQAAPTSGFVASLSTLVFSQIYTLAEDIESFAKHRGGKVVNVEDVLLCARRNEGLHELMAEYARQHVGPEAKARGKKENIRVAVRRSKDPDTGGVLSVAPRI